MGANLLSKALQEEQGTAANSELFALHWLPGAQAPFLVNILDGRTKHNSLSPPRGIDVPSQEHAGEDRPLRPKRVQKLEGLSLLLQEGSREGQELFNVTPGVGLEVNLEHGLWTSHSVLPCLHGYLSVPVRREELWPEKF